jgi:hypothetical protein
MLRALADTELGLWLTISSAATVRSSTATTAYRQATGRHDHQLTSAGAPACRRQAHRRRAARHGRRASTHGRNPVETSPPLTAGTHPVHPGVFAGQIHLMLARLSSRRLQPAVAEHRWLRTAAASSPAGPESPSVLPARALPLPAVISRFAAGQRPPLARGPQTCLGTWLANMSRMILCPVSAVGPNISGQPPSITVIPRRRP